MLSDMRCVCVLRGLSWVRLGLGWFVFRHILGNTLWVDRVVDGGGSKKRQKGKGCKLYEYKRWNEIKKRETSTTETTFCFCSFTLSHLVGVNKHVSMGAGHITRTPAQPSVESSLHFALCSICLQNTMC